MSACHNRLPGDGAEPVFEPDPAPARALERYRTSDGAAAYAAKYQRSLARRCTDQREHRILREMLGSVGRMASILNLPCGAGRFSEIILAAGGRVVFADASQAMLGTARAALGAAAEAVEFGLVDATNQTPTETFDVVICIRMLHHLKDPVKVFRALDYVTASARRAVILTFSSSGTSKGFCRRLRNRLGLRRPGEAIFGPETMKMLALDRGWRVASRRNVNFMFSTQTWLLLVPAS